MAPGRAPTSAWIAFDTALGLCAVAWGDGGLTGSQLPELDSRNLEALRRRMADRFPGVPQCLNPAEAPADIQALTGAVAAQLAGGLVDLPTVRFDMHGVPPFEARVYAEALRLGPGQTMTYGELAYRLGEPSAARAVGQALGHNPFAPVVPCHRVVGAGGKMVGFSAPGGVQMKQRMLDIETRAVGGQGDLF